MPQVLVRKYLSLCLVAVVVILSLGDLCLGFHAPQSTAGLHRTQGDSLPDLAGDDCPCCPADDHSHPDDCLSCDCACHAPLPAQPLTIACLQLVAPLKFHEPFTFLPEVYLPKFIPPQNQA
ncbi:hypothetical protein [Geotalea sp. SG265]|uniref:hypothetical protein n=1 Tax=Geotalea sp. SG265 TaxID=2922867 RepID=UPI001FAEA717|nr:hypothetical protein [Geotalea sp. SG265]